MKRFIISYDIEKPGNQDYHKVITGMERMGAKLVLASVWLLKSSGDARQIREEVKKIVPPATSRILVVEVPQGKYSGWRTISKISEA